MKGMGCWKENNLSAAREAKHMGPFKVQHQAGNAPGIWKFYECSAEIRRHKAVFKKLITRTIFYLPDAGFLVFPCIRHQCWKRSGFQTLQSKNITWCVVSMWKYKSQNPTTSDLREGTGICISKICIIEDSSAVCLSATFWEMKQNN